MERNGKVRSLNWLLGPLWECTDILPGEYCDQLDLSRGSNYAINRAGGSSEAQASIGVMKGRMTRTMFTNLRRSARMSAQAPRHILFKLIRFRIYSISLSPRSLP